MIQMFLSTSNKLNCLSSVKRFLTAALNEKHYRKNVIFLEFNPDIYSQTRTEKIKDTSDKLCSIHC